MPVIAVTIFANPATPCVGESAQVGIDALNAPLAEVGGGTLDEVRASIITQSIMQLGGRALGEMRAMTAFLS